MKVSRLERLTLDAIDAEFIRAHVKHNGRTPRSPDMTDGERLAILVEEIGEVARAMTYDNADPNNLVKELIQVAAMSAAWVEYAETRSAQTT
jgi:NTP pyrophosphatase (non-canonical NTP hydrolase)